MSDDMFAIAIIILVACIIYYIFHKRKHLLYGCGIPEKENLGFLFMFPSFYFFIKAEKWTN